jgi:hydrogenase nickel incorporation protein HypB
MCTVCGCGQATAEGADGAREHVHGHDHDHHHDHARPHHHLDHGHDHRPLPGLADGGRPEFGLLDYGAGLGGVHVPGMSPARIVQVEQDILGENDRFADGNRAIFAGRGILALNLVSSPGSGKTTLLVRTIEDLGGRMPLAVIEGDQQTSFDADRIRATGVPAMQINTGKGCHLDAHMVGHGVERLDPDPGAVLFIENVGNLVCPAAFDLGEAHKVVMLSVTEGDDKPLKYPDMFHAADLMVLTKIDLLPYVPFDVDRCVEFARRVNPAIEVIHLSATSGEGLDAWYRWIDRRRATVAGALDIIARVHS